MKVMPFHPVAPGALCVDTLPRVLAGAHDGELEGEDVALKLIHLTDTHMVPKGRKLFGRDPRWFWMPPSPTSTPITAMQNSWS